MPTATTQAVLTLADVALELDCSELMVRRLIALGHLAAARIGERDKFRITKGALDRYIEKGSPGMTYPVGLIDDQVWFGTPYRSKSQYFEERLREVIAKQLPTDRIPPFVKPNPDGRELHTIEQPAAMTSELQELLLMDVPYGTFRFQVMPGETPFKGRWRTMFMINELHSRLRGVIEGGMQHRPPLHQLYGLPSEFKTLVDAGWEAATTGRIGFTREYHVEVIKQGENVTTALVGKSDHTPAKHRVLQTIRAELFVKLEEIGKGIRDAVVRQAL